MTKSDSASPSHPRGKDKPMECYLYLNSVIFSDMAALFSDQDFHDVKILVGPESQEQFGVNSTILSLRSGYFKDILFPATHTDAPGHEKILKLQSIKPDTFRV